MWMTVTHLFVSGGFAFVYEAQDMSGGKDYALKVRFGFIQIMTDIR